MTFHLPTILSLLLLLASSLLSFLSSFFSFLRSGGSARTPVASNAAPRLKLRRAKSRRAMRGNPDGMIASRSENSGVGNLPTPEQAHSLDLAEFGLFAVVVGHRHVIAFDLHVGLGPVLVLAERAALFLQLLGQVVKLHGVARTEFVLAGEGRL